MTSRDLRPDDGPELLPPAELLRLRAELARPPAQALRERHLAATAMAARQRGHNPMGRFASRSARAAVAVVAALAITSGLAGAQLLPDQAQRLLSNVSDRFAPSDSDPPAEPATPGDGTTRARSEPSGPTQVDHGGSEATTSTTVPTAEPVVGPATTSATSPTPPTSTTIPGPSGPGSPDDPTDPGPTTSTTVSPSTTTTVPPTTTTTAAPTTTTTRPGDRR